jgi:oxalate decarboxylase/phosphoglucose isomerase-like protein (cupin superfamily)
MTDEYISRQIPKSMTHYVENIGTDDVVFIEVLQADHFSGMGSPLMHA